MKSKSKTNFGDLPVSMRGRMPFTKQTGGQSPIARQPSFSRQRVKISRGFRIAPQHQILLMRFPAVRAEMEFCRRVPLVHAALALMMTGRFSLRAAAGVLGISASVLCVWLQKFQSEGAEGLRPKLRPSARAACRLDIFLG